MFTFDRTKLPVFKLSKAKKFVEFWSKYYEPNEKISYKEELNLRGALTQENVKRLLKWKDPFRLTEGIGSPKRKNEKVIRVLKNLENINKFRNRQINEDEFGKIIKAHIFRTGTIWKAFLFHIARPWEFPLADRNVFAAFKIHNNQMERKEDWDLYGDYREYFFKIAENAGVIERRPTGKEKNIKEIVKAMKKVDDAILMFGKFLKQFGGIEN